MPFSITAELPLGTYRGRRQGETVERVPSPARLHAALLAAAGFGPRAEVRNGEWEPSETDVVALRWLEDNPPDSVSVPRLELSRGPAVAYREDGTIKGGSGGKTMKKLEKKGGVVAVDGAFVWTWVDPPPAPVAESLRALCPDVSHLGTAESPVRLTTTEDDIAPTHRRRTDGDAFSPAPGEDLDVATRGRLDELVASHHAQRVTPSLRQDKIGTDERSRSPVPPRGAVRAERYATVTAASAQVPWTRALMVPLELDDGGRIPERERVMWAVAAHRALISILDRDAPSLLNGIYPDGAVRPANRVALHLLDADQPVDIPGGAPLALAVLIPRDAPLAQLAKVYDAVARLRTLHPRGRGAQVLGGTEERAGDRFWREPAPGTRRLWRTDPAAVPDTRGYPGWTFAHAALLSLGFAWQGQLAPVPGRGEPRDRAVIDGVNAAGAVVLDAAPLRTTRVRDYAHRVNRHAVVRPYRATLHLGDLAPARAVGAIGQARHLGGGLLVPDDRPEGAHLDVSSGGPR